jgi:hypothetical protein
MASPVIPAKAGIQEKREYLDPGACPGPRPACQSLVRRAGPGFARVTALMTFYEIVNI